MPNKFKGSQKTTFSLFFWIYFYIIDINMFNNGKKKYYKKKCCFRNCKC